MAIFCATNVYDGLCLGSLYVFVLRSSMLITAFSGAFGRAWVMDMIGLGLGLQKGVSFEACMAYNGI